MKSIPWCFYPVTQGPLHFRYLVLVSRTTTSTSVLPAPALLLLNPFLPTTISTHSLCQLLMTISDHPATPKGPTRADISTADSHAAYRRLLQQYLAHTMCSIHILTNTLRDHKVESESAKTRQTNNWHQKEKGKRLKESIREKGSHLRAPSESVLLSTGRRQRTAMHSWRTVTAHELRT